MAGLTPLRRMVTKKIRFPCADSLASCGRKADSCKNMRRFINICFRADVAFVKQICLFKASLKGLCHGSPVHFVEFFQSLALNRYGLY